MLCFRSLNKRLKTLSEKVGYLSRSYQSLLDVSKSLAAEISELSEWVNSVKPTLSASRLSVTDLNTQQLEDLLASHEVCKFIAMC